MKHDQTAINEMNLRDVKAAIAMGEINRENLKPECLPDFDLAMAALRERKRRLEWTERRIARLQMRSLIEDSGYTPAEARELVKGGF